MNHCTGMSMLALFLTIHNISGKMYVELRTTFSTATKAYKHTSNQVDIMYLQYFNTSNLCLNECSLPLVSMEVTQKENRASKISAQLAPATVPIFKPNT